MKLIESDTKTYKSNHQYIFLMLLKSLKIESAINNYANKDVLIDYNNKKRNIPKKTWLKYLRTTILNKYTEVLQFKVEKTTDGEEFSFKIFMICKKVNGTLNFTEINVNSGWEDNYINKMQYKLITH